MGQVVPDFAHVQFRGNDNGRRYCMLSAVSAAPGPQGHAFPPIRRLHRCWSPLNAKAGHPAAEIMAMTHQWNPS